MYSYKVSERQTPTVKISSFFFKNHYLLISPTIFHNQSSLGLVTVQYIQLKRKHDETKNN